MIATRLKKGDKIGVVSPSNPVAQDDPQMNNGVRFLTEMGFEVVLGQHVFSNTLGYAALPREKAADINTMFADESVKAIICSQGGYTANACLPYLDWQVIKSNPKIFLGISDISVLLNAIYAQTGLVTFHGNDVMWGFGNDPTPYDIQEFEDRLMAAKIGPVNANRARKTVRSGTAEGVLLGGNLNCLMKLAGTSYFPDFTNTILFVEAMTIKPEECDFMFRQLQQIGVFDRMQGVMVGYIESLQNDPEATLQMEDVLLNVTAEYDFPILKVNEFGHNCPNTTLPVGSRLRMDADGQEIEILEKCIQ
ncbi:MAG: LD-carboxypeptidase [Anaerolineae bacterium]|nr:LD-carboxypeptidase [Anaerolineae bacterium]